MKKLFSITAAFIMAAAVFSACSKQDGGPDEAAGGFDKTAMLRQYADSLIIPGYAVLQEKLGVLQTATTIFVADPVSAGKQAAVKTAYTDAYLQYERVAAFNFGPAETALLDAFLNFSGGLDYSFTTAGELTGFSVDTASIEQAIAVGTYSFTGMSRRSFYSQGFGALGYLLFEPAAGLKSTGAASANRIAYTQAVVNRMKSLVDGVASAWGTYRAEFIANTKTNVGSPIGNMVNGLAYNMDLLKGPRIGWPFGKQSNGIVFANKTEANYAGISVALAAENLSGLKTLYTGGTTAKGLSAYLVSLNQSKLNDDVLAQFDVALARLRAIPDPLSVSLTTHATSVDAAYKEIQKLLTLLKTDVASATAVQISYMDNDGD